MSTTEADRSETDDSVEISGTPPDGATESTHLTRLEPVQEHPAGWWSNLIPGARRERQMKALQHGYMELLTSVNMISTHLDKQVDTQKQMLDLLTTLPEASRELKSMSELTGKQNEVLALIREQLEESGRQGRATTGAISEVHHSLKEMNDTSKTSAQHMETLTEQSRGSDERMQDMLRQAERRHSQVLMAITALAVLVISVFYYTQKPEDSTSPAPVTQQTPGPPAAPAPIQDEGATVEKVAPEGAVEAEETVAAEASNEPSNDASATDAAETATEEVVEAPPEEAPEASEPEAPEPATPADESGATQALEVDAGEPI